MLFPNPANNSLAPLSNPKNLTNRPLVWYHAYSKLYLKNYLWNRHSF